MLTAKQQEAVDVIRGFIKSDTQDEMVLKGSAGTGKTYTLRYALSGIINPNTSIAATLSHAAKKVLVSSVGDIMQCYTLAGALGKVPDELSPSKLRFKRESTKNAPINTASLIVEDECSMMDDKLRYEINSKRMPGSKVIYVGDKYQLPPVGSDSPSDVFNLPVNVELLQPVRFGGDIGEVAQFYRNYVDYSMQVEDEKQVDLTNLYLYKPQTSNIQFFNQQSEFIATSIQYFANDPYGTRILAYKNATIDNINSYLRNIFYSRDRETYVPGEQIIMKKPYNDVYNGEIYIISEVIPSFTKFELGFATRIGSHREDWKQPEYRFMSYDLVLTDPAVQGSSHKITVIREDYRPSYDYLKEKIKEEAKTNPKYWQTYRKLTSVFASISRTYATTTHKAQGQSINNVFVMMNDIFDTDKTTLDTKLRSLYVAASRAKSKLYILTN